MSEQTERIKFLNYFETLTTFRVGKFDEILKQLHEYALKYGLNESDMTVIASVAFKQQLSFARLRKLLMCLIPRTYVSPTTVEIILNQLVRHKDESVLIIKQFLQWLIGVVEFSLVESIDDINTYYHLFIYFTKFKIIDIPASKLLYFLTKPHDVQPSLVERTLRLYKATHGRHFAALLYLFKCYRPDLVPDKIPLYSVHKSFGLVTGGIMENLLYARTRIKKNNQDFVDNDVWNKFGIENVSPGLINVNEKPEKNTKKMYKFILSGKQPSCVLSLLNHPSGMYLIIFGPRITHERLSYQLYFVLYDAFLDRNPNISYEERDKLLERVSTLQNFLQQPIPVVSKFIGEYLMRWDGYEHRKNIFSILEWVHVRSFTEYRQCVLTYLLHIFKSNAVEVKCMILMCLGNFTVNIITLYFNENCDERPSRFLDLREQFSFDDFIKELFMFVQNLCLTAILMEPNSPSILNTVLIIYDNILLAGRRANICFKVSKHIPYSALFSTVPSSLNLCCRLINQFPDCVSKQIKLDFINCLLYTNECNTKTNKTSIINCFNRRKVPGLRSGSMASNLHLEKHYAFVCELYVKTNKTSREETEKFFNYLKKKYLDIFRFLKQNA